ncbi:MAG: winged helix-turn-helix domain-containing protein [Wenzhouxiangella sp.]|jgi:TolB-like protein/DNA-binding winged helix-turn-helix (wHTH) protein/Flp pilus assembly protein TadD|nr:winged helix-turn-helix domain-containing protein [Wenzhouxiangella sp.]
MGRDNGNGYRIGDLSLDTEARTLRRGDVLIELPPLSFGLLVLLAERAPEVVSHDEIAERVWPGRVVSPETLTQRVKLLRQSLGDDARNPRYVGLVRGEGYRLLCAARRVAPVDEPSGSERSTRPRSGPFVLAALAVIVMAVAALAFLPGLLEPDGEAAPGQREALVQDKSVAVLPFDDMTAQGDHAYLADGIADELLHRLSQSEDLRVIARTSSFALRDSGLDIPEIAARLGVRYVLQGSLRESNGALRITAQLVDARDNIPVWSEAYERTKDDALTVQRAIAAALGDLLEAELDAGERPTPSPLAYQHFLQARFYYNRRAEDDMARAEQAFLEALSVDPNLPRAWTGLAAVYNIQHWDHGKFDRGTALRKQRAALERALALDPDSAAAHVRMGRVYRGEGNREAAEHHFQRARQIGARDPSALVLLAGMLWYQGRLEEAIETQRRAIVLDPLAASYQANFGFMLLSAGHSYDAEAALEKALSLSGRPRADFAYDFASARILRSEFEAALALVPDMEAVEDRIAVRAMTAHSQGDSETADELSDELAALDGAPAILRLTEVRSFRGNPEAVFDAMDQLESILETPEAELPVIGQLLFDLRHSPFIGELHADPRLIQRFDELLDSYFAAD